MYLKAGVVKAYVGCREGMLERDLKKRYGHGLAEIAAEIAFPDTAERKSEFDALRRMILFDSRYPITTPGPGGNYHAEVNDRTRRVWSPSDFAGLCRLARRVREHVSRIDGDSNNPGSHHSYRIDDDGYLALRVGGHLRPRITIRFSSEQHRSGAQR